MALALQSKCVVLKSLATFMGKALAMKSSESSASSSKSIPTWYFEPFFRSSAAYSSFDTLLRPSACHETCRCWKANKSEWEHEAEVEDFLHDPAFEIEPVSRQWNLQELLEAPQLLDLENSDTNTQSKRSEALMVNSSDPHM
jgi:hypothetical protein